MLKFIVEDITGQVKYEGTSPKAARGAAMQARVPKIKVYDADTNNFVRTLSYGLFKDTFHKYDFTAALERARRKAITVVRPKSFTVSRSVNTVTIPRTGKLSSGRRFKIFSTNMYAPVYGSNADFTWKAYKLHHEYSVRINGQDPVLTISAGSRIIFISETSYIVVPESHFNRFFVEVK